MIQSPNIVKQHSISIKYRLLLKLRRKRHIIVQQAHQLTYSAVQMQIISSIVITEHWPLVLWLLKPNNPAICSIINAQWLQRSNYSQSPIFKNHNQTVRIIDMWEAVCNRQSIKEVHNNHRLQTIIANHNRHIMHKRKDNLIEQNSSSIHLHNSSRIQTLILKWQSATQSTIGEYNIGKFDLRVQ